MASCRWCNIFLHQRPFSLPILIRRQSHKLATNVDLSPFIKKTTVRTCVGLYDEFRKERISRYRNAPSEGVDITTKYLDTGRPGYKKTIVAVHGTADNFTTFNRMIEHFVSNPDVRLIAPIVPDFKDTRATNFAFWHSNRERRQWLNDLLVQLDAKTVHCLVGHSHGCMPCAALCSEPGDIDVKSLGFVAPQFLLHMNYPFGALEIVKFFYLFKSELGTRLLNYLKFYKAKFLPFKFSEMDQVFAANSIILDDEGHKNASQRIRRLLGKPGFIMFSTNERLIDKKSRQITYELLNINEHINAETDDPALVPCPMPSDRMLSFIVKDAAHFPHAKFFRLTNRVVEVLVDQFSSEVDNRLIGNKKL